MEESLETKVEVEDIILAYEVLLGRKPESEQTISARLNSSRKQVWHEIANSKEHFLRCSLNANIEINYKIVQTKMGLMIVNLADKAISQALYFSGDFETDQIQVAIKIIQEKMPSWRPHTFIDVGANIGTHTFSAMNRFKFQHAIAIEPSSANFHLLKTNVVLQKLEDKITLYNCALGNNHQTVSLSLSEDNYGDHRIYDASYHAQLEDNKYNENLRLNETVEMITPNDIIDNNTFEKESSLIWCDTQGYDLEILNAFSKNQFTTDIPIVIEFWPYGLKKFGVTKEFILEIFKNYSVFNLNNGSSQYLSENEISLLWETLDNNYVDILLIKKQRAV